MSVAGFIQSSLQKKPKSPVLPPPPPPAPSIDEAAMRDENARKFARRKGMKRNVTGASTAAPSVATKQLLG